MGSMATGDEGETRRCDGYPCVNGRTRAAMAMVEGEIEDIGFGAKVLAVVGWYIVYDLAIR